MAFGQMGMSYTDYARSTWSQFLLKCEGHRQLIELQDIKEDRRVREICWQIFCSYPKKEGADIPQNIFEYKTLKGDPTKAQIAKINRKDASTDLARLKKIYEKAGILKNGKLINI